MTYVHSVNVTLKLSYIYLQNVKLPFFFRFGQNALQRHQIHISIDKETTIFGTDDILTSLTTIYLKNYIYLRRNRNLNLNLEYFTRYVKYHFDARKLIAIKK